SPPGQPEGFPGTAELCTNADGSTYCANIGLDPLNCGGCGVVCSATEQCESTGPSRNAPASCQSSGCPSGETFCPPQQNPACGDVCTALDSDPANCGACGHACGTNESCVQGSCS
ncbi:MAG TPA: hypothetical protein VMB50_03525, partial [Myxococcales bacterium]|nr:hypothetical protein [Myxococcales bacterium]